VLCSELQLVKTGDGFVDILPLPCNRWSCDYCAPRRRAALVHEAAAGEPNKILTLTVSPKVGTSSYERRVMLHDAFKKLVKRIKRRFAWRSLPYMAFIERTAAGEPHLHVLLRCGFIPQRWISEQMSDLICSPVVWIEAIKNTRHAVRYVTKYVGKAPAQFGQLRRYWVSRGWVVNPEEKPIADRSEFDGARLRREYWCDTLAREVTPISKHLCLENGWHRFYHGKLATERIRERDPHGVWYWALRYVQP